MRKFEERDFAALSHFLFECNCILGTSCNIFYCNCCWLEIACQRGRAIMCWVACFLWDSLSTLAIQSNHKRWSFSPLKYSKVLQWSSHLPYPGRLQWTNNEQACRGSNANNDEVTSDQFTPPSHHDTEEEVTTSNSCSVWEVHKNLHLIFLLYLQVLYKALLCSWPPRQLTSLWGVFWVADWNYVNLVM